MPSPAVALVSALRLEVLHRDSLLTGGEATELELPMRIVQHEPDRRFEFPEVEG